MPNRGLSIIAGHQDAMKIYKNFRKLHFKEMDTMSDNQVAATNRLLEYCAKIAMVFHIIEWIGDCQEKYLHHIPREIESDMVTSAIAVTEWLMHNNRRIMNYIFAGKDTSTPLDISDEILYAIQKLGGKATESEISQTKREWKHSDSVGRKELQIQLSKMVKDGILESKYEGGKSCKPKVTYMKKVQNNIVQ